MGRIRRVPYRLVLDSLAMGHSVREVARLTGVSKSRVHELRQEAGGMFRPPGTRYNDRYLCTADRQDLQDLHRRGMSIRKIAEEMGRSPSTISRELRRNLHPDTGVYLAHTADTLAHQRQRRPRKTRLEENTVLRQRVQTDLNKGWSPEQISGRLKVDYPDDESMQVSHETIYKAILIHPGGEMKRLLTAHLRTGRTLRRHRGRRDRRGRIPGLVSIAERPTEADDRLVPGHHEGDLIRGTVVSRSGIGTIVERTTGYLTLVHLPDGCRAEPVAEAVAQAMIDYPPFFAKTITWDRGTEMHSHAKITEATGINVYFADPHSPWQRPSNENTNGLLRQYFPKGTDLSVHTADELAQVQELLNTRPRKRLGFKTPAEAYAELLQTHSVATNP